MQEADMKNSKYMTILMSGMLALSLSACTSAQADTSSAKVTSAAVSETPGSSTTEEIAGTSSDSTVITENSSETDLFTGRDLEQEPDLSEAVSLQLEDDTDITVSQAGIYLIEGSAENATITVDADDDAKVQLVLNGASVTNDSTPVINVVNADKVFITSSGTNTLQTTGSFTTEEDAVICSSDDLVFNGTGTLKITSAADAIKSDDEIKVTGSTITINAGDDGIDVHDAFLMYDGSITVDASDDGIHAENEDDDSLGYIIIQDGTINIEAADDAVHAVSYITVDGGTLDLSGGEGLEATVVEINDGIITITASDDGINAGYKSSAYSVPQININGGEISIDMGSGDTDAIDSNGNISITGGTLNISAQSPFDCDGNASKTGGTLIINGTETDTIPLQMMGGMQGMHGMGKGH